MGSIGIWNRRTKINAHVYLGAISPNVVPDVVGEDLRSTSSLRSSSAWEDAVDVGEEAACTCGEVVALVKVNAHRIDRGQSDDWNALAMFSFKTKLIAYQFH